MWEIAQQTIEPRPSQRAQKNCASGPACRAIPAFCVCPFLRVGRAASQRPGGFTVIEVLVSATILAVALLGIIGTFLVSYEDVTFGGRVSRAVQLAQHKVEELKSGTFPPAGGTETADQYTIAWTVSSVGFGAAAGELRRVSVTVTWPQQVRPGRYDLVAFLSKPY